MKIYLLIHEQDTDSAWGCNVKPFTDKQAAYKAMRLGWIAAKVYWEYDSHKHCNEDTCECGEVEAVIREDDEVERWRIEEHELDMRMAVEVKGGLVQNVYANADISVDVYDLDVSDFPDEGEADAVDARVAELEALVKEPGWQEVW